MTQREHLHVLIDGLAEEELPPILRLVESALEKTPDPLDLALKNAPWDDEPLTSGDRTALEESAKDMAEGRVVGLDEARRLLLGET